MPNYYDLNVHSSPEDPPERLVSVAKRYGYTAIAITNHSNLGGEVTGEGVISGIEIVADTISGLRKQIEIYRPKVDVLLVHGGDPKINRAAVENSEVDILAHPSHHFNHILAEFAAENEVAIEFNLDEILYTRGIPRVRALSAFQRNLKLARKFDVSMTLSSGARSQYDLRAPRELIALAGLFGMSESEAVWALSQTPWNIITRNRKKKLPGYVMNGVELL
ncbi:MAG: RNase P subunit p30 family protein [Methanocellales archaeon]|nr:RNase P subunit p30 family protein [Methanocellales archaeon]MDD3291609.1 RNase P subunit p30 family protein [Methanocellales archaeon]MDD5235178.1 RNase P subunit p30 family protein [Methanocellales archaeon]MDD5485392.1 RNase P subunit p30 family protein [Methanocellales archaeon]